MILADVYTWYAQRDWAIAIVLVVLIISLTTIWLNRR